MKHAWILAILTTTCFAQDFWTKERKVETTGLVAATLVDGYTTQTLLHRGAYELNPVARPLVTHGTAGQVAADVLGVSLALGVQYALHRTGHTKAARWAGRIALAAEWANVGRNIYYVKKGPSQ